MDTFPIIDISSLHPMSGDYSVLHEHTGKETAKVLGESLGKFGFVYLKGHGIDNTQVEKAFSVSKEFFTEYQNVCRQFIRTKGLGYTSGKNEKFLKKKNSNLVVVPDDIKHAYDVVLKSPQFEAMPVDVKEGLADVIEKLQTLSQFMLRLICLALGKDEGELINGHAHMGNYSKNPSLFRTTYYPELKQPTSLNQFRISEHTDFGTFTMLFQDDCGGLEALSPDGERFIHVTPIKNTIVVNIGDLLALWSEGKLKSTSHRVRFTERAIKEKITRQSFAWFTYPDLDFQIRYKDSNGNICSRDVKEHQRKRYEETSFDS